MMSDRELLDLPEWLHRQVSRGFLCLLVQWRPGVFSQVLLDIGGRKDRVAELFWRIDELGDLWKETRFTSWDAAGMAAITVENHAEEAVIYWDGEGQAVPEVEPEDWVSYEDLVAVVAFASSFETDDEEGAEIPIQGVKEKLARPAAKKDKRDRRQYLREWRKKNAAKVEMYEDKVREKKRKRTAAWKMQNVERMRELEVRRTRYLAPSRNALRRAERALAKRIQKGLDATLEIDAFKEAKVKYDSARSKWKWKQRQNEADKKQVRAEVAGKKGSRKLLKLLAAGAAIGTKTTTSKGENHEEN